MAVLNPPGKGQIITAQFLGQVAGDINDLKTHVGAPSQEGGAPVTVDPNDPQLPAQPAETWSEIERTTDTTRVEDPSDSSVYVDVEYATSITMARPDGSVVLLVFNP